MLYNILFKLYYKIRLYKQIPLINFKKWALKSKKTITILAFYKITEYVCRQDSAKYAKTIAAAEPVLQSRLKMRDTNIKLCLI